MAGQISRAEGRRNVAAMAKAGDETGRLAVLDAIRGFAALLVVLMHARDVMWSGMMNYITANPYDMRLVSLMAYASAPLMYGAIGVSLLFVLSGYVIHRPNTPSLDVGPGSAPSSPPFDGKAFYVRRFVRIYPTMILALAVTMLCDAASRATGALPAEIDGSTWALFVNLAGLQGILSWPYGSNHPLWSLAIEIQFYLSYPIALSLRRRIGMDAMLLVALSTSVLGAILIHLNGVTAFPQFYVAWWAGAYVADWERSGRPMPQAWKLVGIALLVAGCAAYSMRLCSLGIVLWSLGIAPVLAAILARPRRLPSLAMPLQMVGQFSYTLYAIHFPVIILLSAVMLGGSRNPNIAWSILAAAVTIPVAYAAYWLAERPSILWLKSMRARELSAVRLLPERPWGVLAQWNGRRWSSKIAR